MQMIRIVALVRDGQPLNTSFKFVYVKCSFKSLDKGDHYDLAHQHFLEEGCEHVLALIDEYDQPAFNKVKHGSVDWNSAPVLIGS